MTTYRIEMMTTNNYNKFMTGSNNYWVDKIDIEANTAEEAIEIVKKNNPEMVINTNYVKTVTELEEMEAERVAKWEAEEEKKAKAKARKAEREKEKAEALGLTIEEYEEYERKEKNYKRHLREIKKCEREIERLKEQIKYHKEKAEFWKI